WQDTEDFGKKKEIRSHMYKLREERLRNFYSSATDSSNSEIHRTQSTPARSGDQGWQVVEKNESSPDGKTHSTSRVATTSGSDKIDGGVANYAAKCEQKSSVYSDGDANNFTKSVAASSKNVIHQEAKGGDDNSNFQSFSTSTSSSSKVVTHQQSKSGDVTDFKALPSGEDTSTSIVRRTYTTDVPPELKKSPNYIDGNTKVTTETRTLPDGTKVTTTRYETKGAKTISTSSTDQQTSSKQFVSEQKSSSVKSTSSKSEVHSSNRMIQDSRDRFDDTDRNRIEIIRQIPDTRDNVERTITTQIVRSTDDDINKNVSQNYSKTTSSTVNIQKSHKTSDSKNIEVNVESDRVIKAHDVRKDTIVRQNDTVPDSTPDDVRIIKVIRETEYLPRGRHPDQEHTPKDQQISTSTVRQEIVKTADTKSTRDVRGNTENLVREKVHTISRQPDVEPSPKEQHTTTTTVHKEVVTRGGTVKTQDVRDTVQDNVCTTRVVQRNEYSPRDVDEPKSIQPRDEHQKIITTQKEVITTKTSESKPTTQDDVYITKIIREKEYLPRDDTPGDRTPRQQTPAYGTPGDRTPREQTPGYGKPEDRTPKGQTPAYDTPGDHTPREQTPAYGTPGDRTPREQTPGYGKPGDRTPKGQTPAYGTPGDHTPREQTPAYGTPGDRTPRGQTPGDRTPAASTPGDRTPVSRTPGDRTPAVQEIVCHLIPHQERPKDYKPESQQPSTQDSYTTKTTTTTITTHVDKVDNNKKIPTDDFTPNQKEPSPQYEVPERRQPIKPGKSELDKKPTPTDGQYQTTYRTDYVNRRISVEVSPTHDAFARSLRAISPDREKKRGSTRSLKSSTSSLRSSTSPEKYPTDRRQPGRVSPDRKPGTDYRGPSPTKRTTPDKFTSSETITKITTSPTRRTPNKQSPNETINTDTITRRRKDDSHSTITCTVTRSSPEKKPNVPDERTIDSSTLTKRPKNRPRSRSTSPTSIASDIEFVKSNRIITDLDDDTVNRPDDKRPTSLDVITTTTKKATRKITERSPTSPLSPAKDKPQEKPLKRRDTYEERCRQILGITDKTTVTETKKTTTKSKLEETPRATKKPTTQEPSRRPSKSPEKTRSPTKEIQEFPSQIRRSPEKHPAGHIPEKQKPTKEGPKIQEFPSQIGKSPEKQPLQKPAEKIRPSKEKPGVQEFPSQIRKSPEKSPQKERPVTEQPSQVKKIPLLDKAPGAADEPLFTKRFISTLCRDEEIERFDRTVPQDDDDVPIGSPDQPHRTVKKDSPEKELNRYPKEPSVVNKTFIDTEKIDTDITISQYEKDSKYPRKPDRTSPERSYPDRTSPGKQTYDSDTRITTTKVTERTDSDVIRRNKVTEYVDDYETPDKQKPLRPDRRSPTRTTKDVETTRNVDITEYTDEYCKYTTPDKDKPTKGRPVKDKPERESPERFVGTTEYTDEYITKKTTSNRIPIATKPSRPDRESPTRSTTTENIDVTEYTDEYCKYTTPGQDKPMKDRPGKDKPERDSPERFIGTTEYTTTTRTQTTSDRIPKATKPSRPRGDSPTRPSKDTEITENLEVTEYTDEYRKHTTPDKDKPTKGRPGKDKPERESPEKIVGTTEYTTTSTTRTQKTTSDRIPKPTKPSRPDDEVPTRPKDVKTTEDIEVTEYIIPGQDRPTKERPGKDKPERESPEKIVGTAEYTTTTTTRTQKTTSDRIPKPTKPSRPDDEAPARPKDVKTTKTTEVTEYITSSQDKPTKTRPGTDKPERESPERFVGTTEYTTTTRTQKTTSDRIPKATKPSKLEDESPTRPSKDTEITENVEVTEYTDEYCKYTPDKDKPAKTRPGKDKPERESPERFVGTTTTRTQKTTSERIPKATKPSRPDQVSPIRPTKDTETTEDIEVTEYTDEYSKYTTPGKDKPTKTRPGKDKPERESPERTIKTTEYITTTTRADRIPKTTKPSRPDRESPTRTTRDDIEVTEYTDEYCKYTSPTKTRPSQDKPERASPERFVGTTEYTDEYTATNRTQKTTSDRITKTTKSKHPTGKTPISKEPDKQTADCETANIVLVRTVKQATTTLVNGDVSKKPLSPSKSGPKSEPKSRIIIEYPSQKPKPDKTTPVSKTTKTTTVRKDKIENLDSKTRIHKTDDSYIIKTTKVLTNGDVPKHKISPKPTKPGITEYPSQKTPDRRKPTTDRPTKPETISKRKPLDVTPDRKTPKKPETIKFIYSPQDKPRSPERYSPTRHTTDKERIYTTQTVTQKTVTKKVTDTNETKPKAKSPVKSIPKQPETQQVPKRHVVTTTIHVTPKAKQPESLKKPVQKTTVAHTVVHTTRTKDKLKPRKPLENGRVTTTEDESDSECEIIEDTIDTRYTRKTDSKVTRTTSDQIIKTPRRTPVRGQSKPEISPSAKPTEKVTRKTDKKVITTKSIIINNDFNDEREIVVNLQRSKSSREPTPDRICPRPASEDEDTGIPRYPDQISEPDEPGVRRKPTRLSDIPIIESEDTSQFTRITQYDDTKTEVSRRVNRVEETDECLLSVNQKVSKFVDEAGRLTKKPQKPLSPTRKSPRPDVVVDETDETYTSVSDKVSKFVTTSDHLTTRKHIPERPKSPKCKNYPDIEPDDDTKFSSVSEKVSHFIETAEKVKYPQKPTLKDGPAPKVKRPDFVNVEENIRTDECLLSVSDKVTKFTQKLQSPDYKKPVSLAKMDITPKRESPTRESPRRDSPRRESPSKISTECVQIDTEEQTYTRRVSPDRYSPSRRESSPRPYTTEVKTPTKQSTITKTDIQQTKYTRKDSSIKEPDSTPKSSRNDDEPHSVLSPTGRLRSTESIRKAKELFENIAKEQKVTTKQRDILNRPSVFDGKKPKQPEEYTRIIKKEDVKLTDIGVYNVKSKLRYSSDEDVDITDTTRKTIIGTCNRDDNLKSTRLVMDRINRSRSPERDGDTPGYLRPLDRSPRPHSPYQDRSRSPKPRSESPSRERSPRPHDPSLDEIPHYMWPLDRTLHDHSVEHERSHSRSRESTPDHHAKLRSRGSTPDRHIPGYMKPLDRHVRPRSPHRTVVDETEEIVYKKVDDTDKKTKFGVTLRRTDSGRAVTTGTTSTTTTVSTSQKRKLSQVEIERILTTQEIETIYDVEILEILLERAVNYEQRRRIRSQIRIVKQLIADNKLAIVTSKKTTKTVSPTRDSPKIREKSPDKPVKDRSVSKNYQYTDSVTKKHDVDKKSEYHSSYSYSERRTSSEMKTHVRSTSPETKIIRGKSPEKVPRKSITTTEETITRRSPERKTEKTESRTVFKTELRRTTPVTKTVVEEKPSWITQRPLKKVTDSAPSRKGTSTSSTTTTTKKQTITRTSPSKERKPTDDITSSYGVGPTDENGSPLFGLKALRAQNKTDTTKVQGTVIRSHYYSENGQEPIGEISVTKYSTDPRDLEGNAEDRNGLVSVTTTQKFGTKGTPSYRTITDKKRITEKDDEDCETVTRKSSTTKVSRRGSVKEMSKKFIENAVETSKNERQSSYPKAGLILRTSSFKDTAKTGAGSSRESSPEKETVCKTVTVKKTTSSSSSGGRTDTFLNNQTRVRGVQDVITRMKNADDDYQADDTPEDKEARSLLNKFIGSQVILSGMETRSSSSPSGTATTTVKRTTTTSSTSKGGGKPTVITRTFTHPITEEDLTTVWDEQTLKLLLERSTEYEERQLIRARLREVMAEQEESSTRTVTEGPVTTTQVTTTRVTSQQQVSKKPMSPFAKFRQLDKQNSLNTPPGTPRTPTGSRPLFKFTDPELNRQASTVKERLLQWCQMKTKEYENVQLDNFSSSWADGLAFCALIHHFLPDAFDYHALTPKERRHNFTLAFRVADEKADIVPLLDVDDMVATRKPDWKCVFTYVQTIYARFKNED
ncbi:hypothetical protein ILUMI_08167, partial [Ignelater luminosus]